ncbi:Periplasmic sensor signal transduction histidine kinase [Candidatus Sulfotelmatobacter kueseliae]|jgi:signal transduction histidine kinase|uniref:histidine kinase n=1 Tax=Candidatus Sulfotelmatobacter kueseliae TaxID=2042962 RepID=A0A2U3K427_9BACT|nr:Periplasmic sensor signal transduction histidine kinase [Candidatus Sulfotelmatobacter kueseliae]
MPDRPESAAKAAVPVAEIARTTAVPSHPSGWPGGAGPTMSAGTTQEEFGVSSVRVNWQLKAILPVGFVLLAGLLFFTLATVSLQDPERHAVLMVAGAGAIAICAVLIGALAYLIQQPMVELQEKIGLVSEGNLNVAVSFSRRNDEIGDLGRKFNHMMQQLRESREEIERLHQTQVSRAEHLATLGELATGLAHEIRNPLAGIAGVIEIIGRDLPSTSPARAVVKDVRLEIAQINRILTDLLETARPHPPQVRLSNLNTTVEHAVMLARQQVLSKPIKIELQQAPELSEVEHDSDQIHQVLLNLLLNAVQAMEAGTVRVEISRQSSYASVLVSDTGRGIAPQHLSNIFRPFYTTKGNGTGLGLSLARRIVEEHHGRIEVSSVVGQGSKFTMLLPFQMPAARTVAS